MAITVTPLLTTIYDADSTTSWTTTTGWNGLDTDFYIETTASLCAAIRDSTRTYYYDFGGAGGTNVLQTTHIYAWMFSAAINTMAAQASGGIQIYVADTSGNTGRWYVGGSDTYAGGWECFAISTTTTFDATTGGNPTMSSLRYVGVAFSIGAYRNNVINCWWDVMRYGSGLQVTSDSTDTITFENIYTTDSTDTNAYGIISKFGGTYFLQGELVFGSTASGQHIAFSDSDKIVVFRNRPVASTLYQIKVLGNSSGTIDFQLGTTSGSGATQVGYQGVVIKSAVDTLAYKIDFANTYIDNLKLYGSQFINAAAVDLGSTSTALGQSGSTIHFLDNAFNNTDRITHNMSSSATVIEKRNVVVVNDDTTAALGLYDTFATDSAEWQIISSTGFVATSTGTQTLEVSNHNFNLMSKPYLTVAADEIWDVINPTWTITDQTEVDFTSSSSNIVNEKFELSLTIQTKTGTAIEAAITAIFEGTENQNLPVSNYNLTDVSGLASSDILKRTFVDGGGSDLTITTYGTFALKVYAYTYGPFVAAITATAPIDQTVTLVTDSAIGETTQATAVQSGRDIIFQELTVPLLLFSYDDANNPGNNVKFVVGEAVTGGSSGDTGTVVEVSGTATSGKLVIRPDALADTFDDNETITGDVAGEATVDKGTTNDTYTWEVAASAEDMTVVYDYLAAKMAQAYYPDALADDGGAFTDETDEAKDETTGDMTLLPATPAQNDAYYFGSDAEFFELQLTISAADASPTSTIVWEYYNGSWTDLGETDGTAGLTTTGTNSITWPRTITDWTTTTVNSVEKYWIRARESNASPSWSPAPAGTQAKIDPHIEATYIWGEDEQSQLLYSGASGYYTERNLNLTQGVFVSDRGTGTINYFTADGGATFTPETQITLTITGVVQNTQVYIAPSAGGTALLNTAATTLVSGNIYKASTAYTYTDDLPVVIRAREMGYLPYESSGTITSGDFTITAVWLTDPNWKLVVSGVNITFDNASGNITRASGNFTTDGWLAVMGQVTVEGSSLNDGTYTITAVGTTTITVSESISDEGPSSGITLTYTRVSL